MSKKIFNPNPEFAKNARIGSMEEYQALQNKAMKNSGAIMQKKNLTG